MDSLIFFYEDNTLVFRIIPGICSLLRTMIQFGKQATAISGGLIVLAYDNALGFPEAPTPEARYTACEVWSTIYKIFPFFSISSQWCETLIIS